MTNTATTATTAATIGLFDGSIRIMGLAADLVPGSRIIVGESRRRVLVGAIYASKGDKVVCDFSYPPAPKTIVWGDDEQDNVSYWAQRNGRTN